MPKIVKDCPFGVFFSFKEWNQGPLGESLSSLGEQGVSKVCLQCGKAIFYFLSWVLQVVFLKQEPIFSHSIPNIQTFKT